MKSDNVTFHPCVLSPLYAFLHSFTIMPLNVSLLHPYILEPFHHYAPFTLVPLCPFTTAPLCICTLSSLCHLNPCTLSFTPGLSQSSTIIPLHPFTLQFLCSFTRLPSYHFILPLLCPLTLPALYLSPTILTRIHHCTILPLCPFIF